MNNVLFRQHDSFKRFCQFVLLGIVLSLWSGFALAGSINLTWDASTSKGVGGYKLYYGKASRKYSSSIDVGNKTTYQLTGLTNGVKYFFALKAYNTARTVESSFSNEINATVSSSAALTAGFTANKTSGAPGMIVSFTPVTTGAVTGWRWAFGDGGSSTAQNPTHTYNVVGNYSVSLTVTGASGSATKTVPNYITVTKQATAAPVANFTASRLSGSSPLSVGFNNTSTGKVTSWLWSFGDGSTSTAQNPTHVYTAAGTYSVSLKATGPGGNDIKTSAGLINVSSSTVNSTGGLVAAFGFEETGGAMTADASGNGNHGVIKEAVRVANGRYGNALKFDGVNDWVAVQNSDSLALTTGLTIEAWVKPTVAQGGWRTVVIKEQSGQQVYTLAANSDTNQPAFIPWIGGEQVVKGGAKLAAGQWRHLAATYDGVTERLYIDGKLVGSRAKAGAILTSNGALRIGGNSIWGEFFKGVIDEVRIYNRALTAAELLKDKGTPVNVSNPLKVVLGNNTIQNAVDSAAKGVAKAIKIRMPAGNSGVVSDLRLFVDPNTAATRLVAGIYDNNSQGHPGNLLAQGVVSKVNKGNWNKLNLPALKLQAGKVYWFAVLGANGQLRFRHAGNATQQATAETSVSKTLAELPKTWAKGVVNQNYNGPISMIAAGYKGP